MTIRCPPRQTNTLTVTRNISREKSGTSWSSAGSNTSESLSPLVCSDQLSGQRHAVDEDQDAQAQAGADRGFAAQQHEILDDVAGIVDRRVPLRGHDEQGQRRRQQNPHAAGNLAWCRRSGAVIVSPATRASTKVKRMNRVSSIVHRSRLWEGDRSMFSANRWFAEYVGSPKNGPVPNQCERLPFLLSEKRPHYLPCTASKPSWNAGDQVGGVLQHLGDQPRERDA